MRRTERSSLTWPTRRAAATVVTSIRANQAARPARGIHVRRIEAQRRRGVKMGTNVRRFVGVALTATLCTAGIVAQDRVPQSGPGSPAERRITSAERTIAANPKLAQPYNDLALA